MIFLTWDHQEKTRKLEEEFTQFKKNNREAMALLYIVASDPELEERATKSLDDDGYFQVRLFKQHTQDLEGADQALASLAISLFSKDSFDLNMLAGLNNDQLNIALEAVRYCYRDVGGIYDVDEQPTILKEAGTATPLYVGQTQIAEMIKEQGEDMDRRKIAVYYQRGHLPEPDVMIGKLPGWEKGAIQKWIEDYQAGRVVKRRNKN